MEAMMRVVKIKRCGWCKRRIRSTRIGRPRLNCSNACRQAAYTERRLDAAEQAAREAGREQAIEELRGRTYLA